MSGFVELESTSNGADEAEARLRLLYGQRVDLTSHGVNLHEKHMGDTRFNLSHFHWDGGFNAVAEFADEFVVCQVTRGPAFWEIGRDGNTFDDGQPILFQPGRTIDTGLHDLDEHVLSLNRRALEETARAIYADDRLELRFDDNPRPITPEAGRTMGAVLGVVDATRHTGGSDLVRASMYRLLAVTTLETFRLAGDQAERHETATAMQAAYRRATAFIDDHASLPITVQDITLAAGVSLPALRAAFRTHSPAGLSPERYLRRSRLTAAHLDLIDADPTTGDTVQAIALRWGFAYPGNFARHYRELYRVNPNWTLRR